MDFESSNSRYEDDDSIHLWYKAATGGPADVQRFYDSIQEDDAADDFDNEITTDWYYGHIAEPNSNKKRVRSNEWYYKVKEEEAIEEATRRSSGRPGNKSTPQAFNLSAVESERESIHEPRLTAPDVPYFEYLFADAGLERDPSYDSFVHGESFADETAVTEEYMSDNIYSEDEDRCVSRGISHPTTPPIQDLNSDPFIDSSAIAVHEFTQAGIPVTTRDLAENYRLAIGTGVAAHVPYVVDEAEEAEKADASAGFYGGFVVEESPSPFHAPNIDDSHGFGDVRDGAEAFPEQWPRDEPQPKKITLAEADAMAIEYGDIFAPPKPMKPVLVPKSQKPRFGKNKHRVVEPEPVLNRKPTYSFIQFSPNPDTSVKKRVAEDSILLKDGNDASDDEVEYLFTKKLRVSAYEPETEDIRTPLTPTYSLITDLGADETQHDSTVPGGSKQDVPPFKGFPGQFHGMRHEGGVVYSEISSICEEAREQTVMGDLCHANYVYLHTNFHPCNDPEKIDHITDHSPYNRGTKISDALEYADGMNINAARMGRTKPQEDLRREIHIECASARLEGVAVGRYRYYQGHLNVEEYKDLDICVCWEVCACSKMCTRYGDMICPCSEFLELQEL